MRRLGVTSHERSALSSRLARIVGDRRVAFLLVGGFNTAFAFALFVAFEVTIGRYLDVAVNRIAGSLVPLFLSYAIAITVAFVLYRRFVFRVRGHVARDFLRFVSVYILTISVNAVLLPVAVEFGVHRILAQLLIVVLAALMSYFGHRNFSFSRPGRPG